MYAIPNFEAETTRLINAIKMMNSADARNEMLGALELTYQKGLEKGAEQSAANNNA